MENWSTDNFDPLGNNKFKLELIDSAALLVNDSSGVILFRYYFKTIYSVWFQC